MPKSLSITMNVLTHKESHSIQLLLSIIFLGVLFTLPVRAQQFGSQKVIVDDKKGANHVVAADLTGDGLPEVISGANKDGNHSLSWFKNNGSGFGSGKVIGSGSNGAHEVGVADVDGDGDLDVLAASGSAAVLSWYENQGSGSFGGAQVIDGGFSGRAQAARSADLDGDEDPDILSSDWSGVYWYENQDGSFGGGQSIGFYDDPDEVAVADLNGDGNPDVIGGATDNGEVAWHANQGGGSFSSKQQITTEANGVQKIAAADIDGDGDLDLLSGETGGGNSNKVAWYENQDGSFGGRQIIGEGDRGGEWLAVDDFDGDGQPDVALASSSSNRIGWYRNTGEGFGSFQTISTQVRSPRAVVAADLNGDGDSDLISASQDDQKVAWYKNKSSIESGLADAPWPRDGQDLRSTGRSPNAGPKNGAVKWSFQSDKSTNGLTNVTIGPDGTVYVGSKDEAGNGSDDNNLYAVNSDGSQKWVYDANTSGADEQGDISRGVAVSDEGTLYAGSNSDHLHAVGEDGSRKWTNRLVTQAGVSSSPAIIGDGTIYIGTNEGELHAINPDGSVKWTFDTGGRTHSPAVASDGTIYVGSGDRDFSPGDPGTVYAINPDGTQKWSYQTGGEVKGDPAIGPNGTVYLGARDDKVYALKPDGTLKWSFSTNGYVNSDPAVGPNGTVYIGSKDDHLYALNEDGSLKWKFQTGGDVNSAPAVGGDGRIYFGSRDGSLYAMKSDGTQAWSADLGNPVGSPAIGADGRVYVTAGRKLFAVGSGTRDGGGDNPPIAPVADSPQQAGSEFWVEVKVGSEDAPVSNLFGVSFTLDYEESHLSVVDDEAGDFLGNDLVYTANDDAEAGEIGVGVTRKSGAGGVDGSGVVARVKFKIAGDTPDGTTLSFDLKEVDADDPNENAITLAPKTLDVNVSQGIAVWPGDTDNDGEVNQADVLPLGQHWGTTGSARKKETCGWKGWTVQPWSPKEATYADANGDGTVDQADVLCIGQNWGKTHSKSSAVALATRQPPKGTVRLRRVEAPGPAAWYELRAEGTGPIVGASAELRFPPERVSVVEVRPGPAMGSEALFESKVRERKGTVAIGASRKGEAVPEGGVFARVKMRVEEGPAGGPSVTVREATAGLASGRLVPLEGTAAETAVSDLLLQPPSPNPVRAKARVRYALPEAEEVRLSLYNALGQEVKVLVTGRRQAGRHATTIGASELASGLYLLRLEAGGRVKTRKVTIIR